MTPKMVPVLSSCFYAGDSLFDKPERILSITDWEHGLVWTLNSLFCVNNSRSALSMLASIHRAGILHGDIRREYILVGDSGVTIIDFSHSRQCDDQGAMDKEYARLCSFLSFE